MTDANPFETPTTAPAREDLAAQEAPSLVPEGSFGLGFALGFVLGLWGFLGCMFAAKRETKRGAGMGFMSRIGLTLVVVGIMAVVG